jgi:K319L-like, PKD domain
MAPRSSVETNERDMLKITIPSLLTIFALSLSLCAQQMNSANAGLDINGASASGMAPFSASVELPGPLVATISGGTNNPFILIGAAGLDVGDIVFDGSTQVDIGPTRSVLVDGLGGPFDQFFANTGPSGTRVLQTAVPGGTATGSVDIAVQAIVVDFSLPPFNVAISAASTISYSADGPANAPPLADAGTGFFANTNACYSLDASGSVDPDASGSLTYTWTQVSGTSVMLSDVNAEQPTFFAPATATTLVFDLVVNDGTDDSAVDTVIVPVQAFTPTVSFATDVYPLFSSLGCSASGCHSGAIPAGGQDLSGSAAAVYSVIMMDVVDATLSGPRANACDPNNSPIPAKPLAFAVSGVGHGGGDIFASTADPNYMTIITWLQEGAQNN